MCKKVIFLFILVLGFALAPARGAEIPLLSDSFESEPWNINWDANDTGWTLSADGNSHSGDFSALTTGDFEGDLICDPLNTSDASIIKLDFWIMNIGVDEDEFVLEALKDGSVWQEIRPDLAELASQGDWYHYACGFIDSNYLQPNFQINLYSWDIGTDEYLWLDDVTITKIVADTYDVNLLDDGFESTPFDANWNDVASNWAQGSFANSGSYSAAGTVDNQGQFVCNALDTSDAAAVKVDFWVYKSNIDETAFPMYYRSTDGWEYAAQLDTARADNQWLHFEEVLVESKYFHTDFQLKFHCTLDTGENVYVDDVLITKRVIKTSYASVPNPSDGATGINLSQQLRWKAGEYAKTHDVYFGTNESAVDSADKNSNVFMGTQPAVPFEFATFDPNDPTSSELLADVWYYWRIDEANEDKGEPNYWKGEVWSFRTKPPKAENPDPWDGARHVNLSRTLSWTAGDGSIKHTVYFGTDETLVADSCDLVYKTTINAGDPCVFTPPTLTTAKNYYWKIDSNTGTLFTEGDVWSFKTVGTGVAADPNLVGWWPLTEKFEDSIVWDASGNEHHGTLVGDRVDIVTDGQRGYALELTNPSYPILNSVVDCGGNYEDGGWANLTQAITLTAWFTLESHWHDNQYMITKGNTYMLRTSNGPVADSMEVYMEDLSDDTEDGHTPVMDGKWHHIAFTYDPNETEFQRKLYIDSVLQEETTVTGTLLEHPDTFVIGGRLNRQYNIRGWDGRIGDVRLYKRALTDSEIYTIYKIRVDPNKAWEPYPSDRAIDVGDRPLTLTWKKGDKAAGSGLHRVYFGTDKALVDACDASVDYGPQDVNYLNVGELPFATTYYWRVDETDGVTTWKGLDWTFAMANFKPFEDFESYDFGNNLIGSTWEIPDWTGGVVNLGQSSNNEPVNGGIQSMKYEYDNEISGWFFYSEAYRDFGSPQDWSYATGDVKSLRLYFYGETGNYPDDMYVVLNDSGNESMKLYDRDLDDLKAGEWKAWDIDLSWFTDGANNVNLASVDRICIGFGERGREGFVVTHLAGTVYFDDFRVYPPHCVPDRLKPDGDVIEDCIVDYEDVDVMMSDWLDYDYTITPSNPGDSNLVGCWNFDDGTANDSSGKGHHGTIVQSDANTSIEIVYDADLNSNVLDVNNPSGGVFVNSVVDCNGGGLDPGDPNWSVIKEQLSIAAWFKVDTFFQSHYMLTRGSAYQVRRAGSTDEMQCYMEPLSDSTLSTDTAYTSLDLTDGWHHIASTYDSTAEERKVYVDGRLVGRDTPSGTLDIEYWGEGFTIGGRLHPSYNTRGWDGRIDDVRLYDDVLTHQEVVYLAGYAGPVYFDILSPANLTDVGDPCDSRFVNYKDFDILADNWLTELLWPSGW